MTQSAIWRRYHLEMAASLLLYGAVLVPSILFIRNAPDGVLTVAVGLAPMLPALLLPLVLIRHLRRVDEYLRLKTMEMICIAAGLTAVVAFTYGFLENLGWPKLSMFAVWPFMGTVMAVHGCLQGVRGMRRSSADE